MAAPYLVDEYGEAHSWDEYGLCNHDDAAHWFADAGDHEARRHALDVCQRCPVRLPCLDEAIRRRFPGIWGGTTENERNKMARAS